MRSKYRKHRIEVDSVRLKTIDVERGWTSKVLVLDFGESGKYRVGLTASWLAEFLRDHREEQRLTGNAQACLQESKANSVTLMISWASRWRSF